jgi:hypothetical protein
MAIKQVRLVKNKNGSEPEYESISAASTVIDGDLLVKTNNAAVVCASAAAVVSYFSQAAGTSTVPGTSNMLLGKIQPGDTFEINYFHPNASLATIGTNDLDGQVDYGITFTTVSTVAAWFVDGNNTSQKVFRIIENIDGVTVSYPRCRVQALPAACTFA